MADIGRIDWIETGGDPTIALVGEFDLSNAPALVQCFDDLAACGGTKVVVDLAETTFIDSTILGAFALAYRRGLFLDLRGASGFVRREIDGSGLSAVFDVS